MPKLDTDVRIALDSAEQAPPKKKWQERIHALSAGNWRPNHTKILVLMQRGEPIQNIAQLVGVSRAFIYALTKDPYFQAKLNAIQNKTISQAVHKSSTEIARDISNIEKARTVLEKAALDAAMKMDTLMRKGTNKESLQFAACKDILDRVNLKGKETIVTETRAYSPEEIMSAKETLLEMEAITTRVSVEKSRFVLPQHDETAKATNQSSTETGPDGERTVLPGDS